METLLILLTPLLLAAVLWGAGKLLRKTSMDINTQIRALTLVKTAVEWVEDIAKDKIRSGFKMDSESKLSLALSKIDYLAKTDGGKDLLAFLNGKQKDLVEAMLVSPLTSAALTPGANKVTETIHQKELLEKIMTAPKSDHPLAKPVNEEKNVIRG
jgi:hypothetical protein